MLTATNFRRLFIFFSLSLTWIFETQHCHAAPISNNNLDEEIQALSELPLQSEESQLAVQDSFDEKNNLWDNLQIEEKIQAIEIDTDKKSDVGAGVEFQGEPILVEAAEILKNDMLLEDNPDQVTQSPKLLSPSPPLNSVLDITDQDETNFPQSTAQSPIEQKEDNKNIDNNDSTSLHPESLSSDGDDNETYGVLIIGEIVNPATAQSFQENETFSEISAIVMQIDGENSSLSDILSRINSTHHLITNHHETNETGEEMDHDLDDGSAEKNLIDTISAEERASYPAVATVGSKLSQAELEQSMELVHVVFETETTSPSEPNLVVAQQQEPSNLETDISMDFSENSDNGDVSLLVVDNDDPSEKIVMSQKIELVVPTGPNPLDHLSENKGSNVEEEEEMTSEVHQVSMGLRPFYFLVGPFNMKNNSAVPSRNESDVLSTAFIINLIDSKDERPSSPADIIHALANKHAYSISALQ